MLYQISIKNIYIIYLVEKGKRTQNSPYAKLVKSQNITVTQFKWLHSITSKVKINIILEKKPFSLHMQGPFRATPFEKKNRTTLILALEANTQCAATSKNFTFPQILQQHFKILEKVSTPLKIPKNQSMLCLTCQGQVHGSTTPTRSIVIEVVNPLRPLKDLENYTLRPFLKRLRLTMGAYPQAIKCPQNFSGKG